MMTPAKRLLAPLAAAVAPAVVIMETVDRIYGICDDTIADHHSQSHLNPPAPGNLLVSRGPGQ